MLRKCIAFAECKSHTEFRDQRFVKWNSHLLTFVKEEIQRSTREVVRMNSEIDISMSVWIRYEYTHA